LRLLRPDHAAGRVEQRKERAGGQLIAEKDIAERYPLLTAGPAADGARCAGVREGPMLAEEQRFWREVTARAIGDEGGSGHIWGGPTAGGKPRQGLADEVQGVAAERP